MAAVVGKRQTTRQASTPPAMKLTWSPQAKQDVAALFVYVAEDNPMAAHRIVAQVALSVEQLLSHPAMGRPGRVPGTRELVVSRTPYIVPYRVRGQEIEILRVFHAARSWPDAF
jgi:toxin ParE1/3/4